MPTRRSLIRMGAVAAVAGPALSAAGSLAPAFASPGPRRPWGQLYRHLTGDLVLPTDPRFPKAKQLAAAQFDGVTPAAIAYCETEQDVRTCLTVAQDLRLRTAVRSGGHSFAGWSTAEGGLIIDVSRMAGIRLDGGTVRLGPGAQLVDLVATLSPHGVSAPGGFCPTVCAAGLIQGGGMGWHTRRYGPVSDSLRSARVVLADGRVVRCSPDEEPELFWGLRGGGGGNFGIVTALDVAVTPVDSVGFFTLAWPWADAEKVITTWQHWVADTPSELASNVALLLANAAPGNAPLLSVQGAYLGTRDDVLDAALTRLIGEIGTAPVSKLVARMPYSQAAMKKFGCDGATTDQCHRVDHNPEATLPRQQYIHHRSRMLDRYLPVDGVDAVLAALEADRRAGQYRFAGLLALNGEYNQPAPDATAYVHRRSVLFTVFSVGLNTPGYSAEDRQAAESWVNGGFRALDRHADGHTYVNYPDPALPDWQWAYYGTNYPRLQRLKSRVDPHRFFDFPHAVQPAGHPSGTPGRHLQADR